MEKTVTHIISHTDLDGVTAAAVAWTAAWPEAAPVKITLTGYGEVDNVLLESLQAGQKHLVLDLFCQRQQTVDELDSRAVPGDPPFLFDHHETTFHRYGNRPWAIVDISRCAAAV
ncbi:MAG: phosphohydrolase, partial [Synergistaceae bacterium]|nr:phosphohydrolase [Synergistaceae bacterium]